MFSNQKKIQYTLPDCFTVVVAPALDVKMTFCIGKCNICIKVKGEEVYMGNGRYIVFECFVVYFKAFNKFPCFCLTSINLFF